MKKENSNDYGEFIASDAVRITRLLPGPIERVWAYLTEPEKRATWLAGGPIELRVGGKVELKFNHVDFSPGEEKPEKYKQDSSCSNILGGRVTRCDPPRLLSYTWDDRPEDNSEVTFELTPRDEKVLLVVTHRRLDQKDMASVAGGWHIHLAVMIARLTDAPLPLFWATHEQLEKEYAARLAANRAS